MQIRARATDVGATDEATEVVFVDAELDHPALGDHRGFLDRAGFEADNGQTVTLPGEERDLLIVGLGEDFDADAFRTAAAALTRATTKRPALSIGGLSIEGADDHLAALAEGLVLGAYRYDRFKSGEPEGSVDAVTVTTSGPVDEAQAALDRGRAAAEATCLARDLVNEPGGSLTPTALAERAEAVAAEAGLAVEILGPDTIAERRMGGLLGVSRGSTQEPRFIILRHQPDGAAGHLALVGKGITFDAGGLNVKTYEGMQTMKCDMGGGAAVIGAMAAMPTVAAGTAVTAFVPATDNMLGGDATRPGDVLEYADGTTVEVLNTDAEGRLVLADALLAAADEGPDAIIDLATLTGACMVALGPAIAGLMASDDGWADQVAEAAQRSGERVWRLPLPDDYTKKLDSTVADLKNVGPRYGGALTAGLFLQRFVADDMPWAHLDIAGPAFADEVAGVSPKGGTGFGVRTLLELAAGFTPPEG